MTLSEAKAAIRAEAKERRASAHAAIDPRPAQIALKALLEPHAGAVVSGYIPIGTEIDPRPVMSELASTHRLCLPVTHGRGKPLTFHLWTPGDDLQNAGFGTMAPVDAPSITPDILIVPLLAFDRRGGRMGYGAGHYDRSLAELRSGRRVIAYGFAYGAQEFDRLPQEETDQMLDGIVTEVGLVGMDR